MPAMPVRQFAQGERVVFLGDSITQGGGYIFHTQLFEDLRHPGSGTVMMNAGVSGDSANEGCRRWSSDARPMRPDRVFAMFGVNDVGIENYRTQQPDKDELEKRQTQLEKYADNIRRMADMVLQDGIELVLMTPPGYDQYGQVKGNNMAGANEPGLADCANIVRNIAVEKHLGLVDIHRPYTELLKTHPELHLCGEDRVHPQALGHLLMAALILEATGENGLVTEVELELASGMVKSTNVAICELNALMSGAISFKYMPKALPFPVTPEYRMLDTIYPITEKLNRETIRIKGLPKGNYSLKTDDTEIASATAKELADGVNIATLPTPSQKIAQEAAGIMEELHNTARLVRNVPYMNTVITNQNGNLDDMEECFKVLDKWLEEKAPQSNITYFREQVNTYKSLRPSLAEKLMEIDTLRKKLAGYSPAPFVITVEPK